MVNKRLLLRLVYSGMLVGALVLFVVAARVHDPKALLYASVTCLLLLVVVMLLAAIDLKDVARGRLRQQRALDEAARETLAAAQTKPKPPRGNASREPGNGRA